MNSWFLTAVKRHETKTKNEGNGKTKVIENIKPAMDHYLKNG